MGEVNWKSLASGGNSGGNAPRGKTNYIKIGTNEKVQIRPVGHAIEITKVFNKRESDGRMGCVIVDHTTEEGQAILAKLENDYGVTGSKKYVFSVIDRADGEIKFYEGTRGAFKNFAEWAEEENRDPGGKNGADFVVKATGSGKDKRYSVLYKGDTPFSKEEVDLIKEKVLGEGDYNLENRYSPTPADKISQILFGESPEETVASAAAAASSASDNFESADDDDILF